MPEPVTIGQRFTQLIQHLGLSKNAFAQSLDKTATVIQHLVDERNKPGYDLLCKVFEVYPNVSKDWLMLGTEPMLREAGPAKLVAAAAPATPVADDPIDLASIGGPLRRRAVSTHLQPAEVAATIALAAQASQSQPITPAATAMDVSPVPPVPTAAPLPTQAPPVTPPAPLPPAFTAPDPAYLTALLQGQHIQHQLALAEQRNQHLLEQQQLLQQMVQLLQKSV